MKGNKARKLVSNILLFCVCMVMVIGFFYHGMFYQIGLIPLVVVGGIVVFVVLKTIDWANSELKIKRKGRQGTLLFSPEQIPSVIYGRITTTVRPLKKGRLRTDMLCSVKATLAGKPAGLLLVTDISRKRLNEVTRKDGIDEGIGLHEFVEQFVARYGGPKDQIVRVIQFRVV